MTILTQSDSSSQGDMLTEWGKRFGETVDDLRKCVIGAEAQGLAIYEVEKDIFRRVLSIGRQALGWYLELAGDGNLGEAIKLPDDREVRRLKVLRSREYLSVFGELKISRWAYGSREGQKMEHIPLDSQLGLPKSKFSNLLQEWSQQFVVDQAYAQASENLKTVLGLRVPVNSLERMTCGMAEDVVDYWDSLEVPPPDEEGQLVVATADFKGIPMRGHSELAGSLLANPDPKEDAPKGKKKGKKMVLLGGVYTVDRNHRTTTDVLEALFRELSQKDEPTRRPLAQHKRLRASFDRDAEGSTEPSVAEIFGWMSCEIEDRAGPENKPVLALMDGQTSLWQAATDYFATPVIEILDLLHVTPRLWDAAHIFYPGKGEKVQGKILAFVKPRVQRILDGEILAVVAGLRSLSTRRRLSKKKRKKIEVICGYLERNADRMKYDHYIAQGFPIATGVIEGACRHLVKDRFERSGMRWCRVGAQALLDLRTIHVAKLWSPFQNFRREHELRTLYPFRRKCDRRQLRLVD